MTNRNKAVIFLLIAVLTVAVIAGMIISNKKNRPEPEPVPSSSELPEGTDFEIRFFDVGKADAALIRCEGHYMLIDGGDPDDSDLIYSYLKNHGIKFLDYIVCSHCHKDHAGGIPGALEYADVGTVYAPLKEFDNKAFRNLIKALKKKDKEITIPSSGDEIMLGSSKITFIGPIDYSLGEEEHNNISIVLRIEYGETSFLFAGDAEKEEEATLLKSGMELRSTLLKVGHHGSYSSTTKPFLSEVDPLYAVISVNHDEEITLPHKAIVKRLEDQCYGVYRTDEKGDIICLSDGKTLYFRFGR